MGDLPGSRDAERLTVGAAAELLGVSPHTLRRWDRTGELKAERDPANNYRIYSAAALRDWMARRQSLDADRGGAARVDPTLVGRHDALAELDAAREAGHSPLVVTGPPGVGKTRLVRAWAESTTGRTFCDVSACATLEELALAIAGALGSTVRGTTPAALRSELLNAVSDGPGVLVLDEIDHLDEEALSLVADIGRDGVMVIATCRIRGRIQSERLMVLEPLEAPSIDTPEHAGEHPAVTLFIARARAAGGLERLDADALRRVARIVRRLEGLPLALELAASRAVTVGLARLEAQLDESLANAAGPAAQRVLTRAVLGSVERLDRVVRRTLEMACLLPREFELDELEGVTGEAATVDHVHSLVEHSLIGARQGATASRLRYSIHALVREVVLAEVPPDRRAAMDRDHALWRGAQAAELAQDRSSGSVERIVRAEDSLKRAWNWAFARPFEPEAASAAIDLARALGRTVEALGPSPAVLEILERANELAERAGVDRARRAELTFFRAFARLARSELGDAMILYEEARGLATGAATPGVLGLILCQLAWMKERSGDHEGAVASLEQARAALDGSDDEFPWMLIHSMHGQFELQDGALHEAEQAFERARALAVRLGDGGNEASASGFLGAVAVDSGALEAAERHYDRAIATAVTHRAVIMEAVFRGHRAVVLHRKGDPRARDAYELAIDAARRARSPRYQTLFEGWLGTLLAQEDEVAAAERAIEWADRLDDPVSRCAFELCRGHVDLARARASSEEERPRHVARACQRLEDAAPIELREIRVLREHLERGIALALDSRPTADLVVGWQADWLAVKNETVELKKRTPLKRIVWTLALRRLLEPGRALSLARVLEAGWPGERMKERAGIHRVHVAVSTLRRMGLRDMLESHADGYRFAPAATLALARADRDGTAGSMPEDHP